MGFGDNLGKMVFETTSRAMRQARILSETAKMNALISEEEKKIDNLYFQIGKKYANNHREDYDDELEQLFSALFTYEENIRKYRCHVETIKGIIQCCNCGAQISSNASFCSACGTAISKVLEVETGEYEFVCPCCGYELEEGMRFCINCGQAIAIEEEVNDGKDEEETEECRCPNCGALMEDGLSFCIECGAGL